MFVQFDFAFAKVACQSLVETGGLILYYMLEIFVGQAVARSRLAQSVMADQYHIFVLCLLLMFLPGNSFCFVFLVGFVQHHSLRLLCFP